MSGIRRDIGLRLAQASLGTLVVFGMLSALPQVAFACSCADPVSPCATMKESGAVIFVGRVVDAETTSFTEPGTGAHPAIQFRFAVTEWIQGDLNSRTATIVTSIDGGTCGYPFDVGEEYVVYSYQSPQGLVTNMCSRTAPLSARQEDLMLLREAKAGSVHTRLFGGVYRLRLLLDGGFMDLQAVEGVPDVSVTAQGTENRVTSTNELGEFSIVDLNQAPTRSGRSFHWEQRSCFLHTNGSCSTNARQKFGMAWHRRRWLVPYDAPTGLRPVTSESISCEKTLILTKGCQS